MASLGVCKADQSVIGEVAIWRLMIAIVAPQIAIGRQLADQLHPFVVVGQTNINELCIVFGWRSIGMRA